MSTAEAQKATQKRDRANRRAQTLARLQWAKGQGQTAERLAKRMSRQPNSVLRDLRELADLDQAHERDGAWYLGPSEGPEPTPAEPEVAPERVDVDAAILEVLGDRAMFKPELKGEVWARCERVPRDVILPAIERLLTLGTLVDSHGLLRRAGAPEPAAPAPEAEPATPTEPAQPEPAEEVADRKDAPQPSSRAGSEPRPDAFERALAGLLGVAPDTDAAELLGHVRSLRARRDELAARVDRVCRALDRSGIPPAPEGEDLGYRLGVLEGRHRAQRGAS